MPLLLIEDQPVIRQALAEYLAAQPEFNWLLVADLVEDFLRWLPVGLAGPVLSDIGLPGPRRPGPAQHAGARPGGERHRALPPVGPKRLHSSQQPGDLTGSLLLRFGVGPSDRNYLY
jgi:DNA-binding NarL/FixJ family response regulator